MTAALTAEALAAMEARATGATRGPWRTRGGYLSVGANDGGR